MRQTRQPDGDEYKGVITRRQLALSHHHHHPDEKAGSRVWTAPMVERTEDVREVARLMVGSDAKQLPVADYTGRLIGVVTADDLLKKVVPHLNVISVEDVSSNDLVTMKPDETLGDALHVLREHRITHIPVIDDNDLVGIVSLHDISGFTTREIRRRQGGAPRGVNQHGGEGSHSGYRSHGGLGAREGDKARLLNLPVQDVMTETVGSVHPDQPLDKAVEKMFDLTCSSLVVVGEDGDSEGIVTETDVLESLTWTDEGRRPVQVFGIEYLNEITYDEVTDMIERGLESTGI
ncbi:CBS domain-containing protein [Haladaptatus halobius]|uniref:CBS domain-containing protein n=1 Tax=Haladaptatus halobius TaxID=2884875 RepID=UPI001D0B8EE4|nr:CBS domain-containing protein [Haladaptatus halobius]